MNITLASGQFGWDYLIVADDGRDILIQNDTDYPSIAHTFGWDGEFEDITGAGAFLDDNIGATADDPGYFDSAS